MPIRAATLFRVGAAVVFVTGAGLLIAGTMGTATPLVVAGVILVLASGAAGFMSAFEGGRYHATNSPLQSAQRYTSTHEEPVA
jgi:hypothetical protein